MSSNCLPQFSPNYRDVSDSLTLSHGPEERAGVDLAVLVGEVGDLELDHDDDVGGQVAEDRGHELVVDGEEVVGGDALDLLVLAHGSPDPALHVGVTARCQGLHLVQALLDLDF